MAKSCKCKATHATMFVTHGSNFGKTRNNKLESAEYDPRSMVMVVLLVMTLYQRGLEEGVPRSTGLMMPLFGS